MSGNNQNKQINIRLDDKKLMLIDQCRSKKMEMFGKIPSRSEIMRLALDRYLEEECGDNS